MNEFSSTESISATPKLLLRPRIKPFGVWVLPSVAPTSSAFGIAEDRCQTLTLTAEDVICCGDVILLQIENASADELAFVAALLDEVIDRRAITLIPFRFDSEFDGSPSSELRDKVQQSGVDCRSLFEFQAVDWSDTEPAMISRAVHQAWVNNSCAVWRAVAHQIPGSVFAMVNGCLFGIVSSLIAVWLLVRLFTGYSIDAWRYYMLFSAGPAIVMMLSVRMNSQMLLKMCLGLWAAASLTASREWSPAEAAMPLLGAGLFLVFNRIQDGIDVVDLMAVVFARDHSRDSSEFEVDPTAGIGSGRFILRRMMLPAWRLFSVGRLDHVFISHKNSFRGIELAEVISRELEAGGEWNVFLDRSHLIAGQWRDQLDRGYRDRGLVVCVLTSEDHDSLRWIRRELYAAALRFHRYGTPIPIIVEDGLTLRELLSREEAAGRNQTPLHLVRDRVATVRFSDRARNNFPQRVKKTMKAAVHEETKRQLPILLTDGLKTIAEQLAFPAMLVLLLLPLSTAFRDEVHRLGLDAASVLIVWMFFGGGSFVRILPSWAGGLRFRSGWVGTSIPHVNSILLLLTAALTTACWIQSDYQSGILWAVLGGISLNLADHQLWQTVRLRSSVE